MRIMLGFLGSLGVLSLLLLFYVLAKLSERFGAVIKMPPLYRYYYLACGLLLPSYITYLLVERAMFVSETTLPAWMLAPWFLLVAYHLPMAMGVSLGLFITWRYWSWLITEGDG